MLCAVQVKCKSMCFVPGMFVPLIQSCAHVCFLYRILCIHSRLHRIHMLATDVHSMIGIE